MNLLYISLAEVLVFSDASVFSLRINQTAPQAEVDQSMYYIDDQLMNLWLKE